MDVHRNGSKTLILCDFDGTVSTKDTVNRLIREHAVSSEWRHLSKLYFLGELGSKGVYERVASSLRMTRAHLERFVHAHAELDPAFPGFLRWARSRDIDVKIVSDGFDATIETLLANHGITGLEIFANHLGIRPDGTVRMSSPHADPECGECGTCKMRILRNHRKEYDTIILVGDGTSDRHAASEADLVLALKDLFVYCARTSIPAIRVDGFHEIPIQLEKQISAVLFDLDGTLIDSTDSIAQSFNHMFAQLGYPTMTVEEVARKTTMSLMTFLNSFLKPHEVDRAITIFRNYYDGIYLEQTEMMPGAMETLNELNGTVLQGILTNKRGSYARKLAHHLGFGDRMARIIGAQDGFETKPAPDMFMSLLTSFGVSPDAAVYVGDGPIDIRAARNAHVDSYVVSGPIFSAEELALLQPRRVLSKISDLPHVLQPIL